MHNLSLNVNDCANNVPCAEQKHQMNRRTEFKIIGTIPGKELIYEQGDPGFDPENIEEDENVPEESEEGGE